MAEHKQAEVLRAIADGKAVQWQSTTTWIDGNEGVNPLSFPSFEWRVKTEPKPDVVRYVPLNGAAYGFALLDDARMCNKTAKGFGRVFYDGETGKLKSVEIVE